jgi:hypothetical protein
LLRLAAWRASRSGLYDALLQAVTGKPEPAIAVIGTLLDHCGEALTDTGDAETVAGLLSALLTRGNGAFFQRAAYRRSGRLTDVIRSAVALTGTGLYRPARRFCWVEGYPIVSMTARNGTKHARSAPPLMVCRHGQLRVSGGQVTAIGGSVMLASATALEAALPGVYIDAEIDRQMRAGLALSVAWPPRADSARSWSSALARTVTSPPAS